MAELEKMDALLAKLVKGRLWILSVYPELSNLASHLFGGALPSATPVFTLQPSDVNHPFFHSQSQILPRSRFTLTKNTIKKSNFNLPPRKIGPLIPCPIATETHPDSVCAFYMDDVFSTEECEVRTLSILPLTLRETLIKMSEEIGYGSLAAEFLSEHRDNDRVLIYSDDLSQLVWERLKDIVLSHPELQNVKPFGFYSDGNWTAFGVNPCFR